MSNDENREGRGIIWKWLCRALWTLALATSIWIYIYPVDNFIPESRSDRRPTPVALLQADRADEIETEINRLFDRIEQLRKTKKEFSIGTFNPPASDSQIARLEQRFGPLPIDFKAYLKRHNGTQGYGYFYGYQPLLTVEQMLEQTEDLMVIGEYNEVAPMCHEGCWFHPGAVIFEESDGGGYVINVSNGHIYNWDHDGGPFSYESDSFTTMLQRIVRFLESDSDESTANW